ncbi:phage/plasmid primase P4 family domain-containing protein [Eubacterium sp. CAG:786]|nr:phage/plasmid primase P4 family domain-containing protein [Eubacterium sp. CAG:786]
MNFTLYTANCVGNPQNSLYPDKVEINGADDMKAAVAYDHVCAEFRNSHRSNTEFLSADNIPMDCDNDHSDNPNDWVTPLEVAMAFPGVEFVVVYSRSHMLPKHSRTARPRFHVYFPISPITDSSEYTALKKRIAAEFPYFDNNALDSARLLFGVQNPQVEVFNGNLSIVDFLENSDFEQWDNESSSVPEGSRNSAMSHYAGRIIKRLGNTDEAYQQFLKQAEKCDPPLDDSELQTIWNSAVKFGKKVAKQDGYIPPEQYNLGAASASGFNLKPEDYSDIGQAKVLAREYGNELVYTDATDYMRYDGIRWSESRQLAVGACEDFLDRQLEEAEAALKKAQQALLNCGIDKETVFTGGKALEKSIDENSEKAFAEYMAALVYKSFVMKRRDMKYITSALQAAKPMLLRDIKDFDSQEFLLNTPAATYDLRTGTSSEHSADDLITKVTAVSPSEENMDIWLEAVNSFFCGDSELIEYVQQIVGLAAIGKVYMEALIISYGDGRNGKSTFWNTIARVLGSYSGSISADALTVGCKRNVKPEMAELKGKRLVIAAELEEGMRLNTSVVKQLCSTDEVSAEKKYRDPFRYTPTHTLVLYTNHLPRVGANDEGTWRRLIVIPFNAKIEGNSDIKNYADYLAEKAGGAVLLWIIDGARKVIECNFKLKIPQCVSEAISHYRENNDWLSMFIEDCCEVDPSYTQKSGELYQEYRAYCARTGEYTRSTTDFYTGLDTAGFEKRKSKTGIMVYGIRLKSDFIAD